jgi:PleD family two-component response regulator
LLAAVEEFAPADAAAVLEVSADELQNLITEAGREFANQIATDVVIVEDEPLIALDLARLVTDLGHRVVEVARTATQAIDAARRTRPGLLMADIQLADGSSGGELQVQVGSFSGAPASALRWLTFGQLKEQAPTMDSFRLHHS